MRRTYMGIRFSSSLDGERFSYHQAAHVRELQHSKGYPDFFLIYNNGTYPGLYLELKKETPFRKDGKLKKDPHLARQAEWLKYLREQGYMAEFAWDLEEIKKLIEDYLES